MITKYKPKPKIEDLELDSIVLVKYLKGKPGKDGRTPTDKELLALIKPLIPKPLLGEPGKTPTKEELLALIKPLIPVVKNGETPTDKKLLSLIATLIKPTVQLPPKTPQELRDDLESLKTGEKLSIQAIEGLALILEQLTNNKGRDIGLLKGSIHGGKSKEIRFIDDETPDGVLDGSNVLFITLKTSIPGSLKVYRNGQRMRITEDYTLSGKEITFIVPPENNEIILVDYRY